MQEHYEETDNSYSWGLQQELIFQIISGLQQLKIFTLLHAPL